MKGLTTIGGRTIVKSKRREIVSTYDALADQAIAVCEDLNEWMRSIGPNVHGIGANTI